MKKSPLFAIRTFVVFTVFLWILSSVAEAATIEVDCSSASLQSALEKAKPGDTLLVSGTCKENLVIYEEVARITLDGQGKAAINGPDKGKPTLEVRGRGITIKGFTVSGGRHGISLRWGGQAVIEGNTVQGVAGNGITLRYGSSAAITNNTVQNSRNHGIAVNTTSSATILSNTLKNNRHNGISVVHSSMAWVGALNRRQKTPRPNIIENNRSNGIAVMRGSSARIVGNTIRNNKRNGVTVTRASAVHITSNTIDANGGDGIRVRENSHVGRSGGSKLFRLPNSTTSNNGGFGIRCISNSNVDFQLGSLNGDKGAKDIDPSCVASLKPGA